MKSLFPQRLASVLDRLSTARRTGCTPSAVARQLTLMKTLLKMKNSPLQRPCLALGLPLIAALVLCSSLAAHAQLVADGAS